MILVRQNVRHNTDMLLALVSCVLGQIEDKWWTFLLVHWPLSRQQQKYQHCTGICRISVAHWLLFKGAKNNKEQDTL